MPRAPLTDSIAIAVNDVLYEHWDPIGICGVAPRNEYRSYVPELIELAQAGESAEVIVARLGYIFDHIVGLGMGAGAHQLNVARRIVDLVPKQ